MYDYLRNIYFILKRKWVNHCIERDKDLPIKSFTLTRDYDFSITVSATSQYSAERILWPMLYKFDHDHAVWLLNNCLHEDKTT